MKFYLLHEADSRITMHDFPKDPESIPFPDLTAAQRESVRRVVGFFRNGHGVDPGAQIESGHYPGLSYVAMLDRKGTLALCVTWGQAGAARGLDFSVEPDGKLTLQHVVGDHGPHRPHKVGILYGNALCAHVPPSVPTRTVQAQ